MDSGNNWGLRGKNDIFGGAWIIRVGKQPPVNIRSVSDIRVIILFSCCLQNLLYQTLSLIRTFEEQLDHCCQDLQLRLYRKLVTRNS